MPRNLRIDCLLGFVAILVITAGGQPLRASADDSAGSPLIESDPARASVYVDGRLAGQTPLTFSRKPPSRPWSRCAIATINPSTAATVVIPITLGIKG